MFIFHPELSHGKRKAFVFLAVVSVIFMIAGAVVGDIFETYTNGSTL